MALQSIIGGIGTRLTSLVMSVATVLVLASFPIAAQEKKNNGDQNGRVDCRNAAMRAVDQSGGQLLSVRTSGDQCVVTILVPGSGDNARPRKKTVQISR